MRDRYRGGVYIPINPIIVIDTGANLHRADHRRVTMVKSFKRGQLVMDVYGDVHVVAYQRDAMVWCQRLALPIHAASLIVL